MDGKGVNTMTDTLKRDINHFFEVYESRTAEWIKLLPAPARAGALEEIELLHISILNRLSEEFTP